MIRPRRHPLIVLWCAFWLLCAPLLANAHSIGHFGMAAEAGIGHTGGGDDELPSLERICATCAEFAALYSAPPSVISLTPVLPSANGQPEAVAAVFAPVLAAPPYASRAPPIVP